jgi:hypothetical protein
VRGKTTIKGDLQVDGDFTLGDDVVIADTLTVQGATGLNDTLTVQGATRIDDTTASTSTTSGALRVAGGVGVAGAVNVGGGMTVTPNANAPTSNVTIGPSAGVALQSGALRNVLIGSSSGDAMTTADDCIAIGSNALGANQTASFSVAIGTDALSLATGTANTAIGYTALRDTVGGTANVAVGSSALQANTGIENVAVGTTAMVFKAAGDGNVAIGQNAGRWVGAFPSTTANATSGNSVFIGLASRAAADNETNQVVIAGSNGLGNGSNTTTIGNSSTTGTFIPGGNLTLSNGNLILGTSGNGISFAATSDGSSAAVAAIGVVTRTATNVSDGDTITVGSQVYTFKTALTPADYEVLIGADSTASLLNLQRAINNSGGTPGTDYQVPAANTSATAYAIDGTEMLLRALTAGTAGNSIALEETSAQLSRTAFSGGSNATTPASEILSDYEEGSWTPVLTDGTNYARPAATNSGRYTRIGNRVFVQCYCDPFGFSGAGLTGNLRVDGLPFVQQASVGIASGIAVAESMTITAGQTVCWFGTANTRYFRLFLYDSTAGVTALTSAEGKTGRYGITGSYQVA